MDVGDLRRGGRSDLRLLPSYCPHIPVIKYLLFSLSRRGDVIKDSGGTAPGEAYNGVKPPAISLEDYLYRWVRYSFCSSETFVLAVILIDRLAYRTGLLITSINVHRLLLVALVLAAKFRDDVYYSNKYYASVGGVTAAEMNALEISALADLDWELYVDPDQYNMYVAEFQKQRTCKQLSKQLVRERHDGDGQCFLCTWNS
ncbi:Cyclin-U4-1 [Diplonema papillatum]|nr:Cyclin-U4-1 [Diplonema papillatum]